MIGRQGLAYGGHETSESLYNYLGIRVIIMEIEIIKTFSKHNELLQKHLDLAIKKTTERKEMKLRKDVEGSSHFYRKALSTELSMPSCHSPINEIHYGG